MHERFGAKAGFVWMWYAPANQKKKKLSPLMNAIDKIGPYIFYDGY